MQLGWAGRGRLQALISRCLSSCMLVTPRRMLVKASWGLIEASCMLVTTSNCTSPAVRTDVMLPLEHRHGCWVAAHHEHAAAQEAPPEQRAVLGVELDRV